MLTKHTFFICLLWVATAGYSQVVAAHSTLFATYIIKNNDAGWELSVNFPLYSMHKVLLNNYTEDQLRFENGDYKKQIVVDYLLENIEVIANDKIDITLKNLSTSLDNHQSTLYFSLQNMPAKVNKLDFNILAMSENPGHVNAVRIFLKDGRKKVVLQNKNQYQGSIDFSK